MKKGFTIIEVLTSITVFLIVIVAFLQLFNSGFSSQRKSLNSAYLLDNVSFLTEYVARSLRMAQKDVAGSCITAKHNYQSLDGSSIKFLNYNGECQEFFLEEGKLMLEKSGTSQALTPADLEIENVKFEISGESQEDLLQPKITLSFEIKTRKEPVSSLNIQTTVSQRQLDVIY